MRKNISLRTTTTIIFAGAFLLFMVIVIMARYTHDQFKNVLIDFTKQQMLVIAKSTAASLEHELVSHLKSLPLIAHDPLFKNKRLAFPENGIQSRRLHFFYDLHRDELDSLAVYGPAGSLLAMLPKQVGKVPSSVGEKLDTAKFLHDFQPQVKAPFSDINGKQMVSIDVPVEADGELVAVVRAMVDVKNLISRHLYPMKFDRSILPVLIDENGLFISSLFSGSNDDKISESCACVDQICVSRQLIKEEIAVGRAGVNIINIENDAAGFSGPFFVAYAPIRFTNKNWAVGIMVPFSFIAGPIDHHSKHALMLVGAVLFFFGLGVTMLLRIQGKKDAIDIEAHYLQEIVDKAKELERVNKVLQEQATRDELTGLYNYRYFHAVLQRDFALAARGKTDYSCMIIDLDHFKKVNDEHGHPFGDLVLKNIAMILREEARSTDVVARYGGEEFVVLLPDTDIDGSMVIAERIRCRLESHLHVDEGHERYVTASIGVASFQAHKPQSPQDLLAYADKALYRAKSEQRNRVVIYG